MAQHSEVVTARVAHECWVCGAAIAPGHQYTRRVLTGHRGGTTRTLKKCQRCVPIREAMPDA